MSVRLTARAFRFGGLAALISLVLPACESEPTDRPSAGQADGRSVLYVGEALSLPVEIAVAGSLLVVGESVGDTLLKVFDSHGRYVGGIGRAGAGPGEIGSVRSIRSAGGDSVWILDLRNRRVSLFDAGAAGSPEAFRTSIPLPQDLNAVHMAYLGDRSFAFTGFWAEEARLAFVSPGQRPVFGTATVPGPAEMSPFLKQQAYEGRLVASSGADVVAVASRFAARIDIYSSSGDSIVTVYGGDLREPRQLTSSLPGEVTFGYVELAADAQNIYALLSERSRADSPGTAYFGRRIDVFGWDGTRKGSHVLPFDALGLAVDTAGKRVLTLIHDPEPAIVSVTLEQP